MAEKTSGKIESPRKRKFRKYLKRTALVLGGAVAVSVIATEVVFLVMFGRNKPVVTDPFPLEDWAKRQGLAWTEVKFSLEGNTLCGYYITGPKPKAMVIIAHGMYGSSDGFEPVVQYFAERNYSVLIFDGTAVGRSEGSRVVGIQQSRYDVRAAAEYVKNNALSRDIPLILFGHSAGAYASAVEAERAGADAVVCISAFEKPVDTMRYWARTYASILGEIETPFLLAHEYAALGSEANTSASDSIIASSVPALIAHGANDDAIPLEISLYEKLEDDSASSNAINLYIEENSEHDGHGDILFTEDGALNTALMDAVDRFLQPVLSGRLP